MTDLPRVARVLYFAYAAAFIVFGALSVAATPTEMQWLYGMEPRVVPEGAILLNQYRFLRVVEVGFGLLLLVFRREVFTEPRANAAVLGVFFAIPASRTLSIVLDGWSGTFLFTFMLAEYAIFAILALGSRTALRAQRERRVPTHMLHPRG